MDHMPRSQAQRPEAPFGRPVPSLDGFVMCQSESAGHFAWVINLHCGSRPPSGLALGEEAYPLHAVALMTSEQWFSHSGALCLCSWHHGPGHGGREEEEEPQGAGLEGRGALTWDGKRLPSRTGLGTKASFRAHRSRWSTDSPPAPPPSALPRTINGQAAQRHCECFYLLFLL